MRKPGSMAALEDFGRVMREIEEFLRQNQQDPSPNSGSDDPSDSA